MNTTVSSVNAEHKEVFIAGDFNFDFSKRDSSLETQQFVDIMYTSSLFPLIDKPTRVSSHSAALIDKIFFQVIIQILLNLGCL